MKLKTAGKILAFVAGIVLFSAGSLSAVEVSKSELKKMEEQVARQNAEHKRLQEQAAKINEELKSLSAKMVRSARLIQNSEEKISAMEAELKKLEEELKAAENNFTVEDDNLIRTLSALQNLALKPTESLFVQPLTPVEIIRSAMLLRETVPYLEQNAQRIRKKLEQIEKQRQQVENQVKRILAQKKVLEQEHSQLKSLTQKKSQLGNSLKIQSAAAQKKVNKLASQAQDLRDLLKKLEKERLAKEKRDREEAARRAEEQRRKKQEENQQDALIKFKADAIKELGDGFIKAKGRLPMPARGQVVTRYGEETAKGVSSKGIIIKTRGQAQVIAPFDGTVIFAGPFRGYGNLIIIDHGKGYLSLLAGLETIDTELGQLLLAGEPVGQMPDDDDARLYIEIRKDNHPINPLTWIQN
ncbi:MAG: peptidoglycan DD-metalloendopeptidase family protein [Pseudomonadota bacterium]|nr:peptidoglycan DD-metalloendopeptidase family protein [Pseudomonadota bacterium]